MDEQFFPSGHNIHNSQINSYLDSQGIAHANKGFQFLLIGIRLLLDGKADRNSIMELYRTIAQLCHTNSGYVERSIRESIKRSKASGITNREFFARAVDALIFAQNN